MYRYLRFATIRSYLNHLFKRSQMLLENDGCYPAGLSGRSLLQARPSGACWTSCPSRTRRGRWCCFSSPSRTSTTPTGRPTTAAGKKVNLSLLSQPSGSDSRRRGAASPALPALQFVTVTFYLAAGLKLGASDWPPRTRSAPLHGQM